MQSMNLNNFGRIILTDECQKIEMKSFLKQVKPKLKESLLQSTIELNGLKVGLTTSCTGNDGKRWWFTCPLCERRCGVLYQHPVSKTLGCRICLNLRYRKSAKKGMLEEEIFKEQNLNFTS